MKTKITLLFLMLCILSFSAKAQDTIAAWTFPTGTATDANPDHHNTANASVVISTGGGTSAIDWSKNGYTTKAAQTTGWDGGANVKYWQIEVNTTNYNNLKLYSRQTAGGANPGPRDWKAQYKVGSAGSWTDIPGTTLVNANNWTSAVLTNVSIPSSCNNQASVFLRWLMISDTSIAPPALVLANGTTKIDDIYVVGSVITLVDEYSLPGLSIYPNPVTDVLNISTDDEPIEVCILDMQGREVLRSLQAQWNHIIDVSAYPKGIYLLRITGTQTHGMRMEKIVLR